MTNPPKIPISHGEIPENPYQLLKKKTKKTSKKPSRFQPFKSLVKAQALLEAFLGTGPTADSHCTWELETQHVFRRWENMIVKINYMCDRKIIGRS